jgi:VWFA-related protein
MRLVPHALAALLLAGLALPTTARATEEPPRARVTQVDTSAYPQITLYVSATDATGNPLLGLRAADFRILEEDRQVDITDFSGGGGQVTTALVIDRSGSMDEADKIEGARAAALAFVNAMRPGDRTALVGFSDETAVLQSFTGNRDDLRDAIDDLEADGGTALYDALSAGTALLREVPGRRALILLADGQDCRDDPRCPDEYGSTLSLEAALAETSTAGQPVYVVGLGQQNEAGTAGIDETVLRRIAEETGGEYFYAPEASQLAALYGRLAGDIQQEYRITYRSPRPFYDGTHRDLRVIVGGAPASQSGYLQQHLINVRSNPVVAFALLVPILWALVLPTMLRRAIPQRTKDEGRRSEDVMTQATSNGSVPSTDATMLDRRAITQSRNHAITQSRNPTLTTAAFCDQCGTALRAGASFCARCGAPAVLVREEGSHE